MTLEDNVKAFMKCRNYDEEKSMAADSGILKFNRQTGEGRNKWVFHFENEGNIPENADGFKDRMDGIFRKYECNLLDIILPSRLEDQKIYRTFKEKNKNPRIHIGTFKDVLMRFTENLLKKLDVHVTEDLKKHRESLIGEEERPLSVIDQQFEKKQEEGEDNQKDGVNVLVKSIFEETDTKIFLIKGDAGTGKSVFTLSLAMKLLSDARDRKNNVPFLLRYTGRTDKIEDIITNNLSDWGLETELNSNTVQFLVREGIICLILDGFDEINLSTAASTSTNINYLKNTVGKDISGKIILTARNSFIQLHNFYKNLVKSCGNVSDKQWTLSVFSNEQMKQWVEKNYDNNVWNRVAALFSKNPNIKEICRIPVFLKIISSLPIETAQNEFELIQNWSEKMFERDKEKRNILKEKDDLNRLHEVIASIFWKIGFSADISNMTDLEVILEEGVTDIDRPLLEKFKKQREGFMKEASVGPLTGSEKDGIYKFRHEIFAAYFYARYLAKLLKEVSRNFAVKWSENFEKSIWKFLPDAVEKLAFSGSENREELFDNIRSSVNDSQGLLNLIKVFNLSSKPKDIFKGRNLSSFVNDGLVEDMAGFNFNGTAFMDAKFLNIDLCKANFEKATIEKIEFTNCKLKGAIFYDIKLNENSLLILGDKEKIQRFQGKDEVLKALRKISFPDDLLQQMIVEVFEQLTNVASMPKENLSSSIKKTYKPVEDWVEKLIALLVGKGWIIQRNNDKHLEINRHQRKQKIMQILKDKNKSVKLTNYQGLGDIEEEYKKYFF